jgi:hypothetical protein
MKLIKWLSKLLISTILISSLSAFIMGYVINLYVNEIVRQLQLPGIANKIKFSDILSRLSEDLNISKPASKQVSEGKKDQMTVTDSVSGNPITPGNIDGTIAGGSAALSPSPDTNGSAKDDSVAVLGQTHSESSSSSGTQKQDMIISTEEFAKKKDSLSSEDKMKIFSLVLNKLPQDEVQHLSALLEDGITTEELKEVNQVLQKYLRPEEYKQLLSILNHY